MACLLSFVIELACLFLLSLLALIFTVNFGHNHYIMLISKKVSSIMQFGQLCFFFQWGGGGLGGGGLEGLAF